MPGLSKYIIASPENDFRPPILSYKAFLVYGLLLLLLRFVLGALPASGSGIDSQKLMLLINSEREQRNLVVLSTNQPLSAAALSKSQDMLARGYFDHIDPDGEYVWNKIIAAGYGPYKILGENLAVGFSASEGMIKAWLDSPTHRANLLHQDFRDQGLSALFGDFNGNYTSVTASLFGAKIEAAPGAAQTAPPVPPQQQSPPSPEPLPEPAQKPLPSVAPPTEPEQETPQETPIPPLQSAPQQKSGGTDALALSRAIFTFFGAALLSVLSVDSIIIYKHEISAGRSHPAYHLFGFILIVLVSILIWWW